MRTWLVAVILGLTVLLVGCRSEPPSLEQEVRTLLDWEADGELHLSGGHATICADPSLPEAPFDWENASLAHCLEQAPGNRLARLDEVAARAELSLTSPQRTDARWAQALLALRLGGAQPARINEAMRGLREVLLEHGDDAEALNDLGVALALHGNATGSIEEWLAALQEFERAIERSPEFEVATRNRTAVLKRLGLVLGAADVDQYDSASRRSESLNPDGIDELRAAMGAGDQDAVVRAQLFGAVGSRQLLDFALGDLLGRTSLATGVSEVAAWLRDVAGDSALAGSLEAADTTAWRSGLLDYATGRELWNAGQFGDAGGHFSKASQVWRRAGIPLWPAAHYWLGAATNYARDHAAALEAFRAVSGGPSRVYRGLAHWGLGVVHGTEGNWRRALEEYRQAQVELERVQDPESVLGVRFLLAEAYEHTGRPRLALQSLIRIIPEHRKRGSDDILHNVLVIAGRVSLALGQQSGARAFYRETLLLAEGGSDPRRRAESLLRLAEVETHVARTDSLVRAARDWIEQVPDSGMKRRLTAEADLTEGGGALMETRPAQSLAALERARSYFGENSIALQEARSLERHAAARLLVGDTTGAIEDLENFLRVAGAHSSGERGALLRLMLRAQVGSAERRLWDLLLSQGAWDRVASQVMPRSMPGPRVARLVFAEGRERLGLWVQTTRGVTRVESSLLPPSLHQLHEDAGRFTRLLASGVRTDESASLGRSIFQRLLAPVLGSLSAVTRSRSSRVVYFPHCRSRRYSMIRIGLLSLALRFPTSSPSVSNLGLLLGSSQRDRRLRPPRCSLLRTLPFRWIRMGPSGVFPTLGPRWTVSKHYSRML